MDTLLVSDFLDMERDGYLSCFNFGLSYVSALGES